MLRYCNRSVMPNTKPDLLIDDDGVCNACRAYESRKQVDGGPAAKDTFSTPPEEFWAGSF